MTHHTMSLDNEHGMCKVLKSKTTTHMIGIGNQKD